MDSLAMLKFIAPAVPGLANTALWHSLGRTPTASKWDLKVALGVEVLRYVMGGSGRTPSAIGKQQATTLKDPGVKGKTWVAKAKIEAPKPDEESLREAVFQAIEDMKVGEVEYAKPGLVDIEVEWTGYRPDASKDEQMPEVTEEEKYKLLMAEPTRTSETTILYFHGGAYYLCDPASHRAPTSRLAKESHGRVCSVRYRLAPKHAYPSQLLDALMVYLSLLYPPPGSMHEAVPAQNIVFGGDSAGGNLSFALLQLLLQLQRTNKDLNLQFHGKTVPVPLPAGVTGSSPWFDIARCMPSNERNIQWDYLPKTNHDEFALGKFPKDSIWPASTPRGDLFCDLSLVDHPLVSPLAASDWKNAPPMWMCTGEEMLTDEDRSVANVAASQGVKIQYEEYEAMPHVFSMLAPTLETANRCMRSWGDFCKRCVDEPASIETNGTYVYAKTGKEEPRDVKTVSDVSFEEVKGLMRSAKERRIKAFNMALPKPAL